MASEERDRKFDQALARHLRASAASTEARREAAGEAAASARSACPDAETLAAYHERSLLPEEMNSWKEHIIGCGTCQSILAHLEETDEIPAHAAEDEKVVLAGAAIPAMAATPRAAVPVFEASLGAEEESQNRIVPPAKKREPRFVHGARWRWLVPAGAIAAGLLVWIAMHENQSIAIHNAAEPKVASSPPVAPQPSPSAKEADSNLSAPAASPSHAARNAPPDVTVFNDSIPSKSQNKQNAAELGDEGKRASAGAGVPQIAEREEGLRKDSERRASGGFSPATHAESLDAKSLPAGGTGDVAGAAKEKTESPLPAQRQTIEIPKETQQVQVEEQGRNAQLQNQANANTQKIPGPAPLSQVASAKSLKKASADKPAAPASPPAPVAGAMSYEAASSMDLVTASNLRLIPAPGGAVLWRVGPAGSIQISKDKGSSWLQQTSGVSADLLAGSAPSEKVCWVVGSKGTVLLTMDGGAHWSLLSSPVSDDLGGIQASDALHATVWDSRNTRFFATTDGGRTWRRVAAQ